MKYFQIHSELKSWLYLIIFVSCLRWTNSIKFKPSPCPAKFSYESTTNDDRWYGDITFPVNATIEGSLIRIELDRPSQLLVTTAGPITSKENQVYFITHDNVVLEKGSTYKLIFMVKFDKDNEVPMLETIHFNGQRICPPDQATLSLGGGNDYSTSTARPDIKATAPTDVLSDIDKKPKNPTRTTTQATYTNNFGGGNTGNQGTNGYNSGNSNFGGSSSGNQGNNGYNPSTSNTFGGGSNNGNQGNSYNPNSSNSGGGSYNGNQGSNGYNPSTSNTFGGGSNNGNQGNTGYNPSTSNNFGGSSNTGNQGNGYNPNTSSGGSSNNGNQGNNGYNPNISNNFGGSSNSGNQGNGYNPNTSSGGSSNNGYNPSTSNNFGNSNNGFNNQGNNGYGTSNPNNYGTGGTLGNNGFNTGNQDTFGSGSNNFGSNSNSNQQNGFNTGNSNTFGTNGNINQGNNGFSNNQGNSGYGGGNQGNKNPNQGGDIFNNGGGTNNGFTSRPNIGNEATVSGEVACGTVSIANPLIVLAQNSDYGQWPWHVALFMRDEVNPSKSSYICGGSLVSKNRVITAAHCVSLAGNKIVNPNSLTAYMGKYNINTDESTSQKRAISSFKVNPEYNKANFHNDIAILNLNEDVEYTNYVRPICLWEKTDGIQDVVGQNGYVVGWGYNEHEQLNTELKQATMPIVSTEKCARSDPQFFSEYVSENAFCAGSLNGTGPCKGDSGGGLVVKRNNNSWYLRGIVSVSAAPKKGTVCNNHQYIVFTDTAKYTDFIQRNI